MQLESRHAWYGALSAGVILIGWFGLLLFSLSKPWDFATEWPLALGVVVAQMFLYTGVFITAHDAMHGTACWRLPWLNNLIGRVSLWGYALFSMPKLKDAHWEHHGQPGTMEDPDFHDGKHTSFWGWYGTFLWRYISVWQLIGMAVVFNILLHLMGVSEVSLLLFWVLPSLLSTLQLFFFGTFLTHRDRPGESWPDEHHARSNAWPSWLSFITCYHFGYHLEHHHTPHAPWWALPQVRKARLMKAGETSDVGRRQKERAVEVG